MFLRTSNFRRQVTGLAAAIRALFATGEQGAWYDPSDLSTLYQDSAGTTPVTAVGQPVGLMLDKRLGLVLGSELVTNGGFNTDVSGWTASGAIVTWVSGSMQVQRISHTNDRAYQIVNCVVGKTYQVSFQKSGANADLAVHTNGNFGASAIATISTPTGVFVATATSMYIGFGGSANGTFSFDNISVKLLDGNHASQPTAANRPVLQQDGNGKYYLSFNGTNSSMATAAINFTATDKMTVWAGVTALGMSRGVVVVNTNSTPAPGFPGRFALEAPGFTNNSYVASISKTTTNGDATSAAFSAPNKAVLTAMYDGASLTSAGVVALRTNKAATQASVSDSPLMQVFANDVLYIGARAGTSLFFNGNLHQLIIRGAASNAAQISSGEAFTNSKTGAY